MSGSFETPIAIGLDSLMMAVAIAFWKSDFPIVDVQDGSDVSATASKRIGVLIGVKYYTNPLYSQTYFFSVN